MRHKYSTTALVLGRFPNGEVSTKVALLTPDFGLIRAHAQGLRKPGAKMACALQTFSTADITLIRAKDGWRLTGAILNCNFAQILPTASKKRAARVTSLAERLTYGEQTEPHLYPMVLSFIETLPSLTEEEQDAAECLAALRILSALGHDAGDIPGDVLVFQKEALHTVMSERKAFISRINNGIQLSGM